MIKFIYFALMLMIIALEANAESSATRGFTKSIPSEFCSSAREIAQRAEICMFNTYFSAAAKKCEEQLERVTQKAAVHMKAGFSRDRQRKQDLKFAESLHDYNLSVENLNYLIALNRLAIQEIETYLNKMILPVGERNVMAVACFGENWRAVKLVSESMKEKLKEFQSARVIALEAAKQSKDFKKNIEEISSPTAVIPKAAVRRNEKASEKAIGEDRKASGISGNIDPK